MYQQSKGGVAVERHKLEKINFLDQKSYLPSPQCHQKPSSENTIKTDVTLTSRSGDKKE